MGRPKRVVDDELTQTLQALVRGSGSMRRVAISLELEPTTLARSLASGAFSANTRNWISERLSGTISELVSRPKRSKKLPKTDDDLLQKLHKLNILLTCAIAALEASPKADESSEVTNAGHTSS
jgi:hypothetical protein